MHKEKPGNRQMEEEEEEHEDVLRWYLGLLDTRVVEEWPSEPTSESSKRLVDPFGFEAPASGVLENALEDSFANWTPAMANSTHSESSSLIELPGRPSPHATEIHQPPPTEMERRPSGTRPAHQEKCSDVPVPWSSSSSSSPPHGSREDRLPEDNASLTCLPTQRDVQPSNQSSDYGSAGLFSDL